MLPGAWECHTRVVPVMAMYEGTTQAAYVESNTVQVLQGATNHAAAAVIGHQRLTAWLRFVMTKAVTWA